MKFKYAMLTFLALLVSIKISVSAQTNRAITLSGESLPRPKLVVGIVVDQMRWDFLYRYYSRYGSGGFKRLLKEGFSCDNTNIDYIPTFTAVGHSTIYTGSVPAIHGIVGNDFIIQGTGKAMYCTDDNTVQTVGSTSKAGLMSPRNLLVSTLGDELKLSTNFKSKVIGIALKDRSSILPAGHTADAAYWFDDDTGNWITSTYYMKELPDWMKRYNSARNAEHYLKQDWNTLYPINTYVQSFSDNNPYEGKLATTMAPTLPLRTSEMFSKNLGIIRYTPYGNTLTLDIAKEALKNEALGKNEGTDFLAVSLSSTDYLGHQFGPNSVEIEDTYLRLDRDLSDFFKYLDKQIGKGKYLLFLTADHGAAHNAMLLSDKNIPAGLLKGKEIFKGLNTSLQTKYNDSSLVLSLTNYQVNLNNEVIAKKNLNQNNIIRDCGDYLIKQPGVAYVINMKDIQTTSIPDVLRQRVQNGYHADRSGAVQVILKPGWYPFYTSTTGTTHGSWSPYDTHIPLLFMGWGIKQGKSNSQNYMTDIAPTISALLRFQAPNGSVGKVITEIIK